MFQFRRFPSYAYLIQRRMTGYCPAGFPHSDIPGSMDICSSPRLFAAYRVLLRLLVPRHSPCALSSLTLCFESLLLVLSAKIVVIFPIFLGFLTSSLRSYFCFTLFNFQGTFRSSRCWWAQVDSNHRPHAYQACALTT